ncbi:hypothetical protein FisN_13Lu374 [Fistulifera solaris]|uniref:Uncharacterized protein n=1 Tax=Fistulifera solaris TaxID=1519565 RepID=A0A1Z5KLD5_FISSO|nr:hypothetical protein FisN_13Lu374 [Fistulifera solaris]|eukprot:GAX27089.1 hypothetical protein FisN_13Lu374 [Fistulifera solaris]
MHYWLRSSVPFQHKPSIQTICALLRMTRRVIKEKHEMEAFVPVHIIENVNAVLHLENHMVIRPVTFFASNVQLYDERRLS